VSAACSHGEALRIAACASRAGLREHRLRTRLEFGLPLADALPQLGDASNERRRAPLVSLACFRHRNDARTETRTTPCRALDTLARCRREAQLADGRYRAL